MPHRDGPTSLPDRRGMRLEDAIVETTWLYYHEGLNQSEIATRLGLSRATVVNYLAEGRRRDYVRISLNTDIFTGHRLAARLREVFGLKGALVVPSDGSDPQRNADRVTRAASDWLPQLLEPGDQLGVAWGESVFRLAEAAPRVPIRDLTVVQMVGSRASDIGFAAETCAATLAQRFGAALVSLHAPLLLTERDLAERLKQEPGIAGQLRAVAACNKTVFACGTVGPESHIAKTGLVAAEELARLRTAGATGVICARLIDAEGRAVPIEIEERMISVTLEQMKGKDMALLVATGRERARPARAAIKGGYATHLVTCSDTAQDLLADTA